MVSSLSISEPQGKAGRALFAYAAGDAFGVGYEFLGRKQVVDRTRIVPRRESPLFPSEPWPLGGVSDDTLLTQITIRALASGLEPDRLGDEFLRLLRAAQPDLRGLGPTTRLAIGMELREGEISNGRSNGAMMRCSLLGLAFKPSEEEARRETVRQLAAATHQDASAQFAALMLSAVFSAIYEEAGSDIHSVLESEARALTDGGFPVEESWLERVMTHQPSDQGTQLDPLDTLGAVLWVVQAAPNLAEHFYISCDLGGDTDTVAALAGALGSLRFPNERLTDIQWFGEVNWAEVPLLQEFADILEAWRDK